MTDRHEAGGSPGGGRAAGLRVPRELRREWRRDAAWLAALPRLVAELAGEWGLVLEAPFRTPRSLVVPAGDAVLKLNAPSHFEADHEAEALARWAGRGAVRLLARDDARRALLVERCRPGTALSGSVDEDDVLAALLARLAVPAAPPHPFRLLADEAARWAAEVPRRYAAAGRPFERALLDRATDVFRSADGAASTLVNQDLHGGNVLRAEREPWLVVDPKPLAGEPELSGGGPRRDAAGRGAAAARRRLDALAVLGLDRERLRGWVVAHALAWGWDGERGWSRRAVEAARTIAAA